MEAILTAASAFSSRATRGRRIVLVAYSGLVALLLLAFAHVIAVRVREDGGEISVLALADMFSMMITGSVLFVVAPAMVAAQVAEERRSGTLDSLRTAPVSPTALVAGFLVGAPGAVYLLVAGPLALHVAAGLLGAYPISILPLSLFIIALGALTTMLVAMMLAVSAGREGGGAAPLLVAGVLALGTMITVGMASSPDSLPWAYLHPAGALAALYHSFDGVFRDAFSSPWRIERLGEPRFAAMLALEPLVSIFVYGLASALLLGASRRVLAGEVDSRLTKRAALAIFTLAVFAIVIPLAVTVPRADLDTGHLGGLAFALFMPYLVCAVGATPSAAGRARGARGVFGEGAGAHRIALLMVSVVFGVMLLFYGGRFLEVLDHNSRDVQRFCGFVLLALTVPVYSLWASTRIHTQAGRLAFWAIVGVLFVLQMPAICVVTETYYSEHRSIQHLVANIGLAIGAAVPLFLAWRQAVGDRKARALA